jgi:hypothetical protein
VHIYDGCGTHPALSMPLSMLLAKAAHLHARAPALLRPRTCPPPLAVVKIVSSANLIVFNCNSPEELIIKLSAGALYAISNGVVIVLLYFHNHSNTY